MTKMVSLSEEAYETLSKMKDSGTSFSKLILKLVAESKQKRDFLRFAGSLKSESAELDQFKKQIQKDRNRNTEKI
jgi:predicted CopG family antitoxin